jgi:hypothetical protein
LKDAVNDVVRFGTPAPKPRKLSVAMGRPGTPKPVARTAMAASANAEPRCGVDRVVSESARNALDVPNVPSHDRASRPPLLCATRCRLSVLTPKLFATGTSAICSATAFVAMGIEPPGSVMLLSTATPAAVRPATSPCRAKKPPFELLPCTRTTGESALMRSRAQATARQPRGPTLVASMAMETKLLAGVGVLPIAACTGKASALTGTVSVLVHQLPGNPCSAPTAVPLTLTSCLVTAGAPGGASTL